MKHLILIIILQTLIILSLSSIRLNSKHRNTEAQTDDAANGILKNVTIVVPLKYLSTKIIAVTAASFRSLKQNIICNFLLLMHLNLQFTKSAKWSLSLKVVEQHSIILFKNLSSKMELASYRSSKIVLMW